MKILLILSLLANIIITGFVIHYIANKHHWQPFAHHADIIIIGDSRAAFGQWQEGLKRDITNCGIGGLKTKALLQKTNSIIALHPKQAIIQIGINDIRTGVSLDTTEQQYQMILQKLLQAAITPIVTSVIPVRKDIYQDSIPETIINHKTDILNNSIATYCIANHIAYIDISHSLADSSKRLQLHYTSDGLHLNDKGYEIVYTAVNHYFKP